MESSRPGVKVLRAGLVGVFEGSNGGRCGCHREDPARSLGVRDCLGSSWGVYPMMWDQNSQHPYEKTEANRSALTTETQVAMVLLALCLSDGPFEARQCLGARSGPLMN